jgi:hypothetical protein
VRSDGGGQIPWGCIGAVAAAAIAATASILIAFCKPPSNTNMQPSPTPSPAAQVHVSGRIAIPYARGIDLDTGELRDYSDSRVDFAFASTILGQTQYFLGPRPPALMAVVSSLATSPDECASAPLRSDGIALDQLKVGSALCARTKSNRLSAISVTGISGLGTKTAMLTIHYTTWE